MSWRVREDPRHYDLPDPYRGNIDRQAPLDGRPRGSRPAMSDQDMQNLEVFLHTLTDGYRPKD